MENILQAWAGAGTRVVQRDGLLRTPSYMYVQYECKFNKNKEKKKINFVLLARVFPSPSPDNGPTP
jgi:hypothetical protein